MQEKQVFSIGMALGLSALFLFPLSSEAAARQHDGTQIETKMELPGSARQVRRPQGAARHIRPQAENTREVARGSLQDRIDASLHPPVEATPVQKADVKPTRSQYDDSILGTPLATQEQCVKYLLAANPTPAISVTPERLVSLYYEEGEREGIRPDVAFAQALKETGFFRYGGTVLPEQNNYCGLGTTSTMVKGAYFATAALGVRAHIQHLLAYASTRRPFEPIVDPRYDLVRGTYGEHTLGAWEDLNGRWAVPGNSYGQSILSMFRAMLRE